jgi:hypothetical protein
MASTYSPLKIELIGTGDQAGTWGATTNVNLGTAIEEAITGSANVTFASSNVALALTDTNATQTARNLRLNLTGTVSATQFLFVPAIEKQYIIDNGLTFPITVANGSNSGATGTTITIPAGLSAIVFNDGTNIDNPVSYISSLSNVTINGGTANALTLTNSTYVSLTSNAAVLTNVSITSGNINAVSSNASTFSNVTINGGTANGVTLTNATVSSLTAPLTVAQGGTNRANLTFGSVLVGNNTGTVTLVAPGTANNVLTSNGTHWVSQAPTSTGSSTSIGLVRAISINCILP